MSDRVRPAWLVGDVDRMVEEIRKDYAETEAPYPFAISVTDHARQRGYRWLSALAKSPSTSPTTGRYDYRRTVRLMAAIDTAVDRIVDERMAEIERDKIARQQENAVVCIGRDMDCGRSLPCPDHPVAAPTDEPCEDVCRRCGVDGCSGKCS